MIRYAYKQIDISPLQPMKPAGFLQQTEIIDQIKDTLHARILAFDQDGKMYFLLSVDSLGMKIDMQQRIQQFCVSHYHKETEVTISCTHTHFAPDYKDVRYQEQFFTEVCSAIHNLEFVDTEHLSYSFYSEYYDEVGKSRISNHKTDLILLSVIEIYDNMQRLGTIIHYNCHPTIHNGDTLYFTAEYPGYLLQQLQAEHKKEFFTFLQGPAGDVSTRFTRKSQDYEGMIYLAEKLDKRVNEILAIDKNKRIIDSIRYTSLELPLKHAIRNIPQEMIPTNITAREAETIKVGQEVQKELVKHLDDLPKQITLSVLCLGDLHIIFSPNELFSYYNRCVINSNAILSCYSNGYEAYVTDVDFQTITYESYTDTLTDDVKQQYCDCLDKLVRY